MAAQHGMWVHQRNAALESALGYSPALGFQFVPHALRPVMLANEEAADVFDGRMTLNYAAPAPAITALTFTPTPVADAAAVGTKGGTFAATGGTAPYTYTLPGNDGGNFRMGAAGVVETAVTGLAPGAHTVVGRVTDSKGKTRSASGVITVAAPAPP